jgi:hypothetical protein
MVQVRQGRVNFTTLSELPEGALIMTGTFSINHQPVIILFDSGATYSFISSKCVTKVGLDFYPTKGAYMIATPGGKISSNQIYRKVPIQLGSNLIKIDLLLLDLEGMDVLLGMDWMTSDEDINYNTSTSTPAAPFPDTPDAPPPQAPPPSGPITRARARELNFVMLLKNEGPEE